MTDDAKTAETAIEVLRASASRLRELVADLDGDALRAPAYPSEWTVADVLSHLGSGAEITTGRLDHERGGPEVEPQPVWDRWNAKDPEAKAADAVDADAALLGGLDDLSGDERASFSSKLGPMTLDLATFVRFRVNEHALHSWDVAVVADPTAALAADVVPVVLEQLPMIAGFAGKPVGDPRTVVVRTTAPERTFRLEIGGERITMEPDEAGAAADVELPAEALIRLVYGRLDADHTPPGVEGPALDELRGMFRGV